MRKIDEERCTTSVPYKWLTQNPFHSAYFASLAMAAEMSTGTLALSNIYKSPAKVSMLLTAMQATYFKKAISRTYFTCYQGKEITKIIQESISTGEGKSIVAKSIGKNEKGELIAEFLFAWSFKMKNVSK